MMISFSTAGILTLFLFVNVSCQPKPPTVEKTIEIDLGTVAGNIYTNKSLGFKLKFPETMVVDSREELDAGLKEGIGLMKQGDGNHGKSLDKMEQEERIVFGLNTPDSEVAGVLNISVIRGSGQGNFKDMVGRTLQVIVDSTKSKVVKSISDEMVGGLNLTTFVTSMELDGVKVYTKVYALRRNDHRISISISYGEEKGFRLMENVLNGIEFF